jgi:hypothetical protein
MVDGSNASLFPQYSLAQAGLYPDPTQWSNPDSNYSTGPLPFPPNYVGMPNNAATGQPIVPPPGTIPGDNSYNNVRAMLANPGNPITPGAAYTQAQSQAGGGGGAQNILNNFLAGWQGGQPGKTNTYTSPGIGGGSSAPTIGMNSMFANILGGMNNASVGGAAGGIGGGSSSPTMGTTLNSIPGGNPGSAGGMNPAAAAMPTAQPAAAPAAPAQQPVNPQQMLANYYAQQNAMGLINGVPMAGVFPSQNAGGRQ